MKGSWMLDAAAVQARRKARLPSRPRQPAPPRPAEREPHRRLLLVVESEGAVFDSLRQVHEAAYLPAFLSVFAQGAETGACSSLWMNLALSSRTRGEEPVLILLAALRRLNRSRPSLRRSALIAAVESQIHSPDPPALVGAARREGSPEGEILEWMRLSEELAAAAGPAPLFPEAGAFLEALPPEVEVLVRSSLPEAAALNRWEKAGLGERFLRLAGAERGPFADYLRTALRNGYDTWPILVLGSTWAAWQAAQTVGARFFPILPGAEAESWQELSAHYFPAVMKGAATPAVPMAADFMRMLFSDAERGS